MFRKKTKTKKNWMSYSNIIYILTDPTLSWDFEPPFTLSFKKFFASEKNLFNI